MAARRPSHPLIREVSSTMSSFRVVWQAHARRHSGETDESEVSLPTQHIPDGTLDLLKGFENTDFFKRLAHPAVLGEVSACESESCRHERSDASSASVRGA